MDIRFMGSNLAKSDRFLRAIKIHSKTSFGGEVKLLAPCCEILQHVKDPKWYDRDSYSRVTRHPVYNGIVPFLSKVSQ